MFRSRMTLDTPNRVLTVIAAVFAGVALSFALWSGRGIVMAAITILPLSLGLSWALSPLEVVVEQDALLIQRRAWRPLRIDLRSISEATAIESLGPGAIRLFGVGGFFGSYGLFASGTLGRFRLYATRRGEAVLVRRKDSKVPVVLTPDDVPGTVWAISHPRG